MNILNPADVKSLVAHQGNWCVSLYMPTHPVGREQQQDPIRLKNLLAEAEARLVAQGLRRPEVEALIQPARELLMDKDFWQRKGEGLAVFLSKDFHRLYRVPSRLEELLVINDSFHVKPLLPTLARGERFYVLAISLNRVRLFEGTADTLTEIPLSFPTSMQEALSMDDPEKYLNLHSGSVSTGHARGQGGIFHGHTPADEDKKNILRFFHVVSDGLNNVLEEGRIPMVLAGVDYLLPIYREASSHNNLLRDTIPGNPDRYDSRALHERAWQIVRPIFEESQKKAYEKFEQLHGQGSELAVSDLKTALQAARFGQVETLFVPLGRQKWGRYDADQDRITLAAGPGPEVEDLLDLAAGETLLNSGQVFAVPAEQMPGQGELAAILRYKA